jgi:hypothetical protein
VKPEGNDYGRAGRKVLFYSTELFFERSIILMGFFGVDHGSN